MWNNDRCRHGYFHVVNNDYTHWEMYAIGGSANPTINSQGNRYNAPVNPFAKEVRTIIVQSIHSIDVFVCKFNQCVALAHLSYSE